MTVYTEVYSRNDSGKSCGDSLDEKEEVLVTLTILGFTLTSKW